LLHYTVHLAIIPSMQFTKQTTEQVPTIQEALRLSDPSAESETQAYEDCYDLMEFRGLLRDDDLIKGEFE